ncbi:hypothetical protein M407DRAFT_17939 [Tulasnella calospora MUT 4182]|uniref:Uncharacterized protein n=1 Tax=Tulasnella calospora MUT 4182 TaxID=1051891 RepID=A0A0C3QW60_9AGAM|nr:hypothetical protein M407DRAFT_17939 [Tulasnella calospora MUT 4182]
MSGSAYAQLMLVECCTVCQVKASGVSFDYFHQVRYCETCHRLNIIPKTAVLKLYRDFPPEFFQYLSSETVGSDGTTLAPFRGRWHGSKRQYLRVTVAEVYNLWKSLSKAANAPEQANAQLIGRLEQYAKTRIKFGLKMKDWQIAASERKAAQRAKLTKKRTAFILAKLVDLGYDEVDFPRWNFEVYKSEALTDEEWERIRPTVVNEAKWNKNSRISRLQWSNDRGRALTTLWNEVVAIASGTRTAETGAWSDIREFFGFAPVTALISAGTDGIPAQELDSIRAEALQFAIQERRRYLVKLRNILDGLPLDQTNEEEWSSLSDEETIGELDTIAAQLVKAVNGFWDSKQKRVEWYPSCYVGVLNVDMDVLSPVDGLVPGLIAKMLESIGKDQNTEALVVTSGNWRRTILYRCARCDETVAPYLTFPEMISHFLEKKTWFDKASDAREKVFTESSGSKDPLFRSTFSNDHDWNSEGELMVSDDPHEKARVRKLQNQLEASYGNDPIDYGGEDFTTRSRRSTNKAPQRRTLRTCRLCPEGYSPKPMYFATLKIHIEHIHCKGANVEEDTAAFDPSRDIAPANPCVFDVPFDSL